MHSGRSPLGRYRHGERIRQRIQKGRPFSFVFKYVHNNYILDIAFIFCQQILAPSISACWLVNTLKCGWMWIRAFFSLRFVTRGHCAETWIQIQIEWPCWILWSILSLWLQATAQMLTQYPEEWGWVPEILNLATSQAVTHPVFLVQCCIALLWEIWVVIHHCVSVESLNSKIQHIFRRNEWSVTTKM